MVAEELVVEGDCELWLCEKVVVAAVMAGRFWYLYMVSAQSTVWKGSHRNGKIVEPCGQLER